MDPSGGSAVRERALFGFFLAATADLRAAEALAREVLGDPRARGISGALETARARMRDWTAGRKGGRPLLSPGVLGRLLDDLASAGDESSGRASHLHAALEELAGPPRELLFLRYREGLPIPVLAERLGRSVPAIEMALARARLRLREVASRRIGAPAEGEGGGGGEAELLIERYLGGAAGAEDVRRLEDLLGRDPAGRRAFLLALDEDFLLRGVVPAAPPPGKESSASWPQLATEAAPAAGVPRRRGKFAAAAVLLILAAFLSWLFLRSGGRPGPAAPPPPPPSQAPTKSLPRPVSPPAVQVTKPHDPAPLPPPGEPAAAPAREKTFYFGAAPWPPLIRFEAASPAGPVVGWARAVSGSAVLDLESGAGKVHVNIPVDSLSTGAAFLDGALRAGFDAAGIRRLEFVSESVSGPGRGRTPSAWEAEGVLTVGGQSGPLLLKDVAVAPIEEEAALKGGLGPGEWIRVRAEFQVRPADFGVGMDPFRGLLEEGAVWTVSVDLLGGTARPAGMERFERLPGIAATGVPPPVDPPGGPGKLYRLGRHPAFTLLRAEGSAGIERTEVASRSVWGWMRADPENARARMVLQIPPRSLFSAAGDLRRWLHADLPSSPPLRFESTEAILKDETSWAVRGNLEIIGKTVALYLEVGVDRLEAGSCPAAGLEREGLVLSASFRTGLSDLLPSLVRWDRAAVPWDVRIEVLAEAEE